LRFRIPQDRVQQPAELRQRPSLVSPRRGVTPSIKCACAERGDLSAAKLDRSVVSLPVVPISPISKIISADGFNASPPQLCFSCRSIVLLQINSRREAMCRRCWIEIDCCAWFPVRRLVVQIVPGRA
jgi:hypothetical protein